MNIIDNFIKSYNNFANKLANILITQKTKEKILYFLKNLKYYLLGLCVIIFSIWFYYFYNRNYSRDYMEGFLTNATYVCNIVAINKRNFLASYETIKNSCNSSHGVKKFYIISDRGPFEAFLIAYDEYKNLALFTSEYQNINNFAIFSKNLTIEDDVFLSKTNNNLKYKFYRYKTKEDGNGLEYIKTFDYLRDYNGEIFINDNFELVGMVNSEKNSFFNKNVYITSASTIKQFLKENDVMFIVNYKNSDLRQIKNYLGTINYKLVCINRVEGVSPLIIRTRR